MYLNLQKVSQHFFEKGMHVGLSKQAELLFKDLNCHICCHLSAEV